jgi:hypothetical protein
MALLWAHQYDQPPRLTETRPELAAGLDGVLAKALAKSPEDRYGSCLEFAAALRAAATGGAQSHPPTQVEVQVVGASADPGAPPEPPPWARPVFRRLPG